MLFRRLDSSSDWTFGFGLSNFAQDSDEAIGLNLKTRILSWVGDCPWDIGAGIDWKARLDKGQQAALLADLRSLILQTDGVVDANSVSVDFDPISRGMSIAYDVVTIFSASFTGLIAQAIGAQNA